MKYNLVIVESPAKAKTIVKILGNEFQVKASMGHIRDLPESELGIKVDKDFEPKYVLMPSRKKIIGELKKAASEAQKVYLAPDPDREGEAIAWHLEKALDLEDDKVLRVTFNEITKQAVLFAFEHPRKINLDKVNSQQARRVLDRLVGYKISPLLWKKVGKGLSAGRVQSVTVRMVCEREKEIQAFITEEYWSITAFLRQKKSEATLFTAKLDKYQGKKIQMKSKDEVLNILSVLQQCSFVVGEIKKSKKTLKPLPPFITSLMQQASVNQLKYSVQRTMLIAQQLYEGIEIGGEGMVGLISYMRTDSFNISQDAQKEAVEYVKAKYGPEYLPSTPNVYKSKKSAQEAHEAIRPTSLKYNPEYLKPYLSQEQFRLYELIWERFLASQMAPAHLQVTSVDINAGEYMFRTSGTEVDFAGFMILEKDVEQDVLSESDEQDAKVKDTDMEDTHADEEKVLPAPALVTGESLDKDKLVERQHFTKPPARYTEATLVRALEEKEIGRPSTYAPIIQTIIQRDYVSKDRGRLFATELGMTVNDILVQSFPDILDVKFTANMELTLDQIEEGKQEWHKTISDFYGPFMQTLANAEQNVKSVKRQPIPIDEKCEKCQKTLVIRVGRFGKFVACSGYPECKFTRPLDSGHVCPQAGCNGKLVFRKSKKGKTFYGCSNFPKCNFTISDIKNIQKPGEENKPISSETAPSDNQNSQQPS